MAYKTSGNVKIADNFATGVFNNVTVKNHYTFDTTPSAQGNVSGYGTGGTQTQFTFYNTIDKYPFASDTNATDVGDLTQTKGSTTGTSSSSHGYVSGGWLPGRTNVIERFPFSSDDNGTDVGDLTFSMNASAGVESSSHGYHLGGYTGPPFLLRNEIQRFPFATATTNASDVGDLLLVKATAAGHSESTYGYLSGGRTPPSDPTYGASNVIERFPFAAPTTNSTDVGDLFQRAVQTAGSSSSTHGYSSGGASGGQGATSSTGTLNNVIQKFSFASSANSTDVGDLLDILKNHSSSSSTANGYVAGGVTDALNTASGHNVIQKFPFSSDTNASDVGDLTVSRQSITANEI